MGRRAVSLDRATIGFDAAAQRVLTFATLHGRALTEGTLAYDTLEWRPAAQEGGTAERLNRFEPLSRPFLAERTARILICGFPPSISGRGLTRRASCLGAHVAAGPLSIDIAELAIFGGRIAGRLDYDPGIQTGYRSTPMETASFRGARRRAHGQSP